MRVLAVYGGEFPREYLFSCRTLYRWFVMPDLSLQALANDLDRIDLMLPLVQHLA